MRALPPSSLVIILLFWASCIQNPADVPPFTAVPGYDGWPVSNPAEQNIDPRILARGYAEARELPYAYSLLVVRNGYLVAEEYFHGNTRETPNRIMSVSKSILSALTGIALREGFIDSLGQTALSFFPEFADSVIDKRKFNITIGHLLTMRAGFDGDRQTYFQVYYSSDWVRTTIRLPLVADPGERMVYTTFGTHLLSAVLTKAADRSTEEIARRYLCDPLGISIGFWQKDAQGYYFGGNGMGLRPRDMARFGLLYMNRGARDGKQIIPLQWVEESLASSTGWQHLTWGDVNEYNYGYLWWLGEIRGHSVCFALGHGGQLIMIFPDLRLIVVSTANPDFDWDIADEHERAIIHIIAESIVPAAGG